MSKLDLPCGHKVDETAASRIRTDVKNFYTCRNTPEHPGCEPAVQYYSDPFHWTPIEPRKRVTRVVSQEEQSLREQLKALVSRSMRKAKQE